MLIYLVFAVVAGFLLANQNPINADLRKIVGSPFLASALSNFVGSIFLGIITIIVSHTLFPSWTFITGEPVWVWLGGLLGGIYLTSNVLLFPRLGAVQTVILPILGQILMGIVIDSFGWFGALQISLSTFRFIGILITLVGVLIAVVLPSLSGKSQAKSSSNETKNLLVWRVWAVIVGGLSAIQQAINGHLGTLLHNPSQASFVSFFLGFLAIFLVALIVDRRLPKFSELKKAKVWNGFGGILGALFVLTTVLAVPQIGAGLTIMMALIGQIVGSMLVQQFGWWRSLRYNIQRFQVIGVLVMLLGIVFIKFL
ncbi:DMT family transporter [Lactococcus nasutitermitis]|uniref:DMT family transporter n=1 Tax=Lactococcus nasutitermitis TaxID=1652957 RepID=A0ABV9JC65_9LACT|nr:DMT family transporter [Lactococcus nasutitermitis]